MGKGAHSIDTGVLALRTMTARTFGNVALCSHLEQVRYRIGRKRLTTPNIVLGFLVLTGPAGGISGGLCEN
jgi:hypothetical protein